MQRPADGGSSFELYYLVLFRQLHNREASASGIAGNSSGPKSSVQRTPLHDPNQANDCPRASFRLPGAFTEGLSGCPLISRRSRALYRKHSSRAVYFLWAASLTIARTIYADRA